MDLAFEEPVRVLAVDDEPAVADLVATFLERLGDEFVVETATSAADGIETCSEEDVDCIVSDYDMPDANGLEFLTAVREEHPDLPFILFTGKGSEEVASRAIAQGVTFYQQKGVGTEQYEILVNNIRRSVTERRAVAQAKTDRNALRLYTEAIDSSDDKVAAVDTDWRYLFANDTFLEYHDLDREDVVAEHAADVLGEAAFEVIEPHLERAADGQRVRYEMTYEFEDLGEREIDIQYVPLTDEDGEIEGVVAEMRDVTDQKEREWRMDLYESIVQNDDEGVYVFDREGQVEFVNERIVQITGIDRECLIGEPVSVLSKRGILDREAVARVERAIDSIVEADRDEVRIGLTPDGASGVRELELRLSPVSVGDDSLVLGFSREASNDGTAAERCISEGIW